MPQPQCKPGWAPGGEAQARGCHACNPASISARWNTGSDRGMSGERASLCRAPAAAVPAPAGRRTGAMGSARNHAARPRRAEKGESALCAKRPKGRRRNASCRRKGKAFRRKNPPGSGVKTGRAALQRKRAFRFGRLCRGFSRGSPRERPGAALGALCSRLP